MKVVTPKNCDTSVKKAIQQLNRQLGPDATPIFSGLYLSNLTANRIVWVTTQNANSFLTDSANLTFDDSTLGLTGKMTAGSFGSPIDVTATREYGYEIHYSGNNYNATGIRARASLVTTDTTASAQGGLFQAANNDGINAGVLNGLLIEAIGKSDTTAATISTMRGALVNTEWNAKDTVTDLRILHIRTHTRNNATEGYFSNSGYGIYLENEAVGGNGQALTAGIYFKGTNISGGNYAFDYGIDFTGGTYETANIRLSTGGKIVGNDGTIDFDDDNLTTTGSITGEQLTSTDDITMAGYLLNTMASGDAVGVYIDGDTNPYTYAGSFAHLNKVCRTLNGSGATALPALGVGFRRDMTWDYDFTGSISLLTNKYLFAGGESLIASGEININGGGGTRTLTIGSGYNVSTISGDLTNITAANLTLNNYGAYYQADFASEVNYSSSGVLNANMIGGYFRSTDTGFSVTAGTVNAKYYGGQFIAIGSADGTSTSYGGYFSGTSANKNYDLYAANATSLNIIAGNTRAGGTSDPTNAISIDLDDKIDFGDNAVYIFSDDDGYLDLVADTGHRFSGVLYLSTIKSGATQAGAGAAANEIWKTNGHASLPDNTLMIGV